MSKKTIVFKMPTTDSPRRDDEPSDSAASIDESSRAVAAAESGAANIADAAEPDQWVRRRDLNFAGVAPSSASAAKTSLAIDLAAERDLGQVVALSLIVPPMLGWFWFANAIDRYRRMFAV